jgi:hypothetical protein
MNSMGPCGDKIAGSIEHDNYLAAGFYPHERDCRGGAYVG